MHLGLNVHKILVRNDSSACVWKKFRYHLVQKILVRNDSCVIVRNGIFCTKWYLLYEMVFVRNDLTTFLKWVWSLPAPAWISLKANYAPGYWIVYRAHILDFLQNFKSVKMERIIFFSCIISILLIYAESACWRIPGEGKIFVTTKR